MRRRRAPRPLPIMVAITCFCAGVLADWWLRSYGPPQPVVLRAPAIVESPPPQLAVTPPRVEPAPVATTGETPRQRLRVPIEGVDAESFKGGFAERRDGRPHEAVDILAPRNTEVHAVEDGTIAKLFYSKAGGNTIYQFEPSGRLCFYYAHLERYADELLEGQHVSQGQVIGYVGTSGNAPPSTPHLHFAVFELNADCRWWQGQVIDPYPLFRAKG